MSAVTWEGVPTRAPERVVRPRLVSVPTGTDVPERPLHAVRVTRRGRLVLTLGVALALSVGIGWASVAPSSGPEAGAVVTVTAGQTLSGIVASHLPGVDAGVAMTEVRQLNDLATSELLAGQVLVLPRH